MSEVDDNRGKVASKPGRSTPKGPKFASGCLALIVSPYAGITRIRFNGYDLSLPYPRETPQ
jgi:hypothetical protein